MLKSEGKIDVSDVIDLGNIEDIIAKVAERKLHELSYKPLTALQSYIQKTTGIDLFGSKDVFDIVLVASEVRNLIAHNDCCINDVFRNRVKDAEQDYEVSERGKLQISDEWMRRASYTLDGVVFRFDEAICQKFDIEKHNKFGTFFLRP